MATRALALEQLIVSMLTQDSAAERRNPAAPLMLLASFLAIVGAGFLLAAGYDWLTSHYNLQTARLYMGAVIFSLALLAAAIGYAIHSYRRQKMKAYYTIVRENLASAIHLIGEELEEPIRENPKTSMLVASLAGYIAAEKLLH